MSRISWNTKKKFYEGMQRRRAEYELHGKLLLPGKLSVSMPSFHPAHIFTPCSVAQSCPTLRTTLWTITHQVPLSQGFFRQEYWSGLPFQGIFLTQGLNPSPVSPALQVDSPPLSPVSTTDPYRFQQGYGGHLLTRFPASDLQIQMLAIYTPVE